MFGSSNPSGQSSAGSSPFGQQASSSNPFGTQQQAAFGQANAATNNPFAPRPFGSPTPAFGGTSSPFGGGTSAFGQPSAPAFGAAATGAFGQQPTPVFGSTSTGAFGQQQTPAFGSTSTGVFGQPTTPAFGSTATGAFGQPATPAFGSPSPSPFGSSTSAFGAPPAPAFGATTSNPGTGSLFGQKSSFGGFGSSPNQSTTFGNNNFGTTTTPTFGVSTSTSLFGAPGTSTFGSTTTPGFGSSPSFGQSGAATSNTLFGTTPSSPFGLPTAPPTFGQTTFGNQSGGTRIQPHVQTPDPDGATSGSQASKLDSISAMPAYKEKSHEELRWEDYQRGDKGGPNTTPVVNNFSPSPQPSFPISQPAPVNPFSSISNSTGAFGTTPSLFPSPGTTLFGQSTGSPFQANTSQSLFANTTPSIFGSSSAITTPFSFGPSFNNNSQSAGLFPSSPSPAIGQQPSSHSFNQQTTSSSAFSTSIFNNTTNVGTAGGQFVPTSSPFPMFPQPAPVQPSSSFSFQPQGQPGGFSGVSKPMNMAPFGQQTSSQSSMVMQPTLVSNPFGTLPAMPQMSIGNGGSSPSIQYGISSLPVAEKPHLSRTLSMVVPRHLSQRRIKLLPRKYNAASDGKVPFFADDEESSVTPKADAFFIPRENPRSLIIRQTDQWPSRSAVDRQPIPRDSAHLDKDKDAFVGRERNKAAMSPARSGQAGNGHDASSEPEAFVRHVNGASIEKMMPKLSQADYFTEPSLEELAAKERSEPGYCRQVRDFVVGRQGYGSIKFLGETDVRGLDLESVVEFNNREVVVYKEDSEKPPVGEGLNKAALVTLLNIKCMNRKTGEPCTEGPRLDKFKETLVKTAKEQGAEFVSFDGAKGEWKFRVKHFSSYGFGES
nr:nuclear pore complex protein NUP98A-like isoform X4 [Lolium perenne]